MQPYTAGMAWRARGPSGRGLPLLAAAALSGAVVGTVLGISRFANAAILKALGLVLAIAGLKMIGVY